MKPLLSLGICGDNFIVEMIVEEETASYKKNISELQVNAPCPQIVIPVRLPRVKPQLKADEKELI